MVEDVVSFWKVIERRLQNQPVYQLPAGGKEIVTVLEINDMFLLGLTDEEYEDNKHNKTVFNSIFISGAEVVFMVLFV